ncbi:MAG: hypothetical protein ABSD67_10860 [Terracidiphilus sp.]|jgi:hypothetical protein
MIQMVKGATTITMLNEIDFSGYRLFRGTARILPDFVPAPDGK